MMPLLNGHTGRVELDSAALQRLLADANTHIEALQEELEVQKRKNHALVCSVGEIRRQLSPLHRALGMLFGELDALPSEESSVAGAANPKRKIWEEWTEKFGRDTLNAKVIAALLAHDTMTAPQLRVVMKCGENSVYEAIKRLKKLGLVQGASGRYTLKEL